MKVWLNFLPPSRQSKFFNLPLKEWVLWNILTPREDLFPNAWKFKFPIICWLNWKWRSKFIFQACFLDEQTKVDIIQRRVDESIKADDRMCNLRGVETLSEDRLVGWSKPMPDRVKVNVDGSVAAMNGQAGVGCVARDYRGAWIMGEARFIGSSAPLQAELLGILFGLKMAKRLKLGKITLESDSIEAVSLVLGLRVNSEGDQRIIDGYRELMSSSWDVELKHILREVNQAADLVAKRGSKLDVEMVKMWLPLTVLWRILEEDARGVRHVRARRELD